MLQSLKNVKAIIGKGKVALNCIAVSVVVGGVLLNGIGLGVYATELNKPYLEDSASAGFSREYVSPSDSDLCGVDRLGIEVDYKNNSRSRFNSHSSTLIHVAAPFTRGVIHVNRDQNFATIPDVLVGMSLVDSGLKRLVDIFPHDGEVKDVYAILEASQIMAIGAEYNVLPEVLYKDLVCYLASHELGHAMISEKNVFDSKRDLKTIFKGVYSNVKFQEYLADGFGLRRAINQIAKSTESKSEFNDRVDSLLKSVTLFRFDDSPKYQGTKTAILNVINEVEAESFNRDAALKIYDKDAIKGNVFSEVDKWGFNESMARDKDIINADEISSAYGRNLFNVFIEKEKEFDVMAEREFNWLDGKAIEMRNSILHQNAERPKTLQEGLDRFRAYNENKRPSDPTGPVINGG